MLLEYFGQKVRGSVQDYAVVSPFLVGVLQEASRVVESERWLGTESALEVTTRRDRALLGGHGERRAGGLRLLRNYAAIEGGRGNERAGRSHRSQRNSQFHLHDFVQFSVTIVGAGVSC